MLFFFYLQGLFNSFETPNKTKNRSPRRNALDIVKWKKCEWKHKEMHKKSYDKNQMWLIKFSRDRTTLWIKD